MAEKVFFNRKAAECPVRNAAIALIAAFLLPSCAAHCLAAGLALSVASSALSGPSALPPAMSSGAAPRLELPQPLREWTVIVFSNGKNNLAREFFGTANSLELAGSGSNVNVVMELGLKNGRSGADWKESPWRGTRRFFITKDPDTEQLSSIPLPGPSFGDMGSYRHLARFGKWVKANFPARKYLLVINNHGNGMRGISYDDVSRRHIAISELGAALRQMGGVDVLATDSCLMQMAEVSSALKGSVKAVVASEEAVLGYSFNYSVVISSLQARPGMNAESAAKMLVRTFDDSNLLSFDAAALSALRVDAMEGLAERLKDWTAAVQNSPNAVPAVLKGLRSALKFEEKSYRDLYHFISIVGRNSSDQAVQEASERLRSFIRKDLLLANERRYYKNAYGITIYIPFTNEIEEGYCESEFAVKSGWGPFLLWIQRQGLYDKQVVPWRPGMPVIPR